MTQEENPHDVLKFPTLWVMWNRKQEAKMNKHVDSILFPLSGVELPQEAKDFLVGKKKDEDKPKQKPAYQVVSCGDLDRFQVQVNLELSNGYELCGDMQIIRNKGKLAGLLTVTYLQPMRTVPKKLMEK